MISTLFITSTSSDVLIEKQCGEKIPRSVIEEFWSTVVIPARNLNVVPTVSQVGRYCVVQTNVNDVMLLGVNASECPPMLVVEFLSCLERVLAVYLKDVRSDLVRENFSLVYQLLEEMIDNGIPLNTELGQLEGLVPRPTLENKFRTMIDVPLTKKGRGIEGQVPWRPPGISYSNNEIFFDLTDYVDVTIDSGGKVVRADVRGEIEVNCKLSGMPDVVLRLAGTESFDDVSFHKCIRNSRYEADRTISFIPPDGTFTLLRYRSKPLHNFQPSFYVNPQITYHDKGGRINVMVGLRHGGMHLKDEEKNVHKLVITIPMPNQTDAISVASCTHGTCTFDAMRKQVVWRVGHLTAATTSLSADVMFKPGSADVTNGASETVQVVFQIPNYSVSGTRVSSVSVPNESYKPFKGVKYMTKAGRYSIRTA